MLLDAIPDSDRIFDLRCRRIIYDRVDVPVMVLGEKSYGLAIDDEALDTHETNVPSPFRQISYDFSPEKGKLSRLLFNPTYGDKAQFFLPLGHLFEYTEPGKIDRWTNYAWMLNVTTKPASSG